MSITASSSASSNDHPKDTTGNATRDDADGQLLSSSSKV
jgi:hypothetical protein